MHIREVCMYIQEVPMYNVELSIDPRHQVLCKNLCKLVTRVVSLSIGNLLSYNLLSKQ
jgi:hypothetical protein